MTTMSFATYFFIGLLGILSVYSWALIFSFFLNLRAFRKTLESDRDFLSSYAEKTEDSVHHYFSQSMAHEVLTTLYESFQTLGKKSLQPQLLKESLVERAHLHSSALESTRDHRLTKLATIASVSPYLGLLGTVFGVMQAFLSMSDLQGAMAMSQLAPGLAEALMATALGLFVAIPAQAAHYYFQSAFEASQQTLIENSTLFLQEVLSATPMR